MPKIESYKVDRAFASLRKDDDNGGLSGVIFTPAGLVSVFSHVGREGRGFAVFQFVTRGREYRTKAHRAKPFTARGLAIIAGRFARDVVGRKHAD